MTAIPHIYVVAAERSGDLLGAALIHSLKEKLKSDVHFSGVGGIGMAEEGIESAVNIDGLSILGFIEGLKAYGRVKEKVSETVSDILKAQPDVVVLIDSWGFTLRVAQGVRAQAPHIKLVKYVGPQVFATRRGRAKTLAATVDHLLTILSFDAIYYEAYGLPVTFVGNPTLERPLIGNGAAFKRRHDLDPTRDSLIVLPGSRPSEIKRLFGPFARAIDILKNARPDLNIIVVLADPIDEMARRRIDEDVRFNGVVVVSESEKADAFTASDLALACSGTVVTELSTAGIPSIAAYRLGWITWAIIRGLNVLKSRFISLVNIAADQELVPEYVQTRCTGRKLADEVSALLDDPARRSKLRDQLRDVTRTMRGPGKASDRAASAVIDILKA